MNTAATEILLEKYGQRLGSSQPLTPANDYSLKKEIDSLEKAIAMNKIVGIIWVISGIVWVGASFYSLAGNTATLNLLKVGMGLLYTVGGLFYLDKRVALEKKKVILETIQLLNKGETS